MHHHVHKHTIHFSPHSSSNLIEKSCKTKQAAKKNETKSLDSGFLADTNTNTHHYCTHSHCSLHYSAHARHTSFCVCANECVCVSCKDDAAYAARRGAPAAISCRRSTCVHAHCTLH